MSAALPEPSLTKLSVANRYFQAFIFCAILTGLIFSYFWFFSNAPAVVDRRSADKAAHLYRNSDVSIGKIKLAVFYAVPSDRINGIYGDWQGIANKSLAKISDFHKLQFRGRSEINYEIYPKPVILENGGSFYDSNNNGNSQALMLVAEEIEKRVFKKDGDLFRKNFSIFGQDDYPVFGIIYEGFGAVGGVIEESGLRSSQEFAKLKGLPDSVVFKVAVESADGFFLLSRNYLSDTEYEFSGLSFLYHEFAHAFGVQDYYDQKTGLAFSNDIMGAGLRRPFESNFINSAILKELGVID